MASLVSFRAGQAITAGDVVTVNASGLLYKASAVAESTARVVGLAINGGGVNELITVNKDSYFASLSGLTPGSSAYLSLTSGVLSPSYADWINEVQSTAATSVYITNLGRSITSSGLSVEISKPVFLNVTGGSILLEGGFSPGYLLAEDGSTIDLEG